MKTTEMMVAFVSLFWAPVGVFAQEKPEVRDEIRQIGEQINHLTVVFSSVEAARLDLGLSPDQVEQVRTLRKQTSELFRRLDGTEGLKLDDSKAKEIFEGALKEYQGYQAELYDEVLLPHQVDGLKAVVFRHEVLKSKGNIIEAILKNYVAEFGLSQKQVDELSTIEQSATSEIAKARVAFEKELERIKSDSLKKMQSTLSPEQFAKIRQLVEGSETKEKRQER